MSQFIQNALDRVQQTTWGYDRGVLEIRDAVLLFTNFSGQKNRFGNASKNFNIVLTDDLKNFLETFTAKDGNPLHVNIHRYPSQAAGTEDDPCLYYINVKVNMDSEYPPLVTLYTTKQTTEPDGSVSLKKGKVSLQDATIGCLDRADMDRADCKINIKESKQATGNAVMYLRQLNVQQTIIPDFGGAYEDWDEPVDANPEILAANEEIM